MVDITITPANVIPAGSSSVTVGTAGATVTQGDVVFKDTSGQFQLADADDTALDVVFGIALNSALDGQPLSVLTAGDLGLGAILTAGTPYYLSATPGGIAPHADLTMGDRVIQLGIATTTSNLRVRVFDTGVIL